jgi:hypothetical protein
MNTTKLDLLNIGLMGLSLALACARPFETFLLAYAVLGPLHYLTEMSWLHDRKSFCTRRIDALFLVVPMVFVFLGFGIAFQKWYSPFFLEIGPELTVFTFLSALVYLRLRSVGTRMAGLLGAVGATVLFSYLGSPEYGNLRYWLGVYLATLVHVFLFTALFILLGALRNRSWTSLLSLGVFVGAAAFCLLGPGGGGHQVPGGWARAHFALFAPMTSGLCALFGLAPVGWVKGGGPVLAAPALFDSPGAQKAVTFIAFAYLYHYFNWFSKTSVIGWHRMSKGRAAAIGAAWLASVALYGWNYEAGLLWLALLSLAHVALEFPLNWLSMKEIAFRAGALVGLGARPRPKGA